MKDFIMNDRIATGPGMALDLAGPLAHDVADGHDAQRFDALRALADASGFRQHFQPDSTIILHGDPAEAIYLVESGTVRCSSIDSNGARQIFSFLVKGDILGISDLDRCHFTAEAVDHVIVKSVSRQHLEQRFAVDAQLRPRGQGLHAQAAA